MNPSEIQILATVCFALAVLHTFCVKRFIHWAHKYPEGSIRENILHFLGETEVVFGLWATVLFVGMALVHRSVGAAVEYIEKLGENFNEPKFVLVVMVIAATRPVVTLAESIIRSVSGLLPFPSGASFFLAALALGPLLGSFVTEPAAMTLLAMVLKNRYFGPDTSPRLAYATIGLLFVNVSVGGTLTHFAAPPVLMVATKWNWGSAYMLTHFGWRAAASCLVSTVVVLAIFWKELAGKASPPATTSGIPWWLTAIHAAFLAMVVYFSHHPDVFFGVFVLFLGVVTATREYQHPLKLREGLLVGFFLAGLVVLGKEQEWWLKPLIQGMGDSALYFGATALTAVTDNAALTFLGTLVPGISDSMKYALVAGAVTGGGLTVIANAPNPAGAGILQDAPVFRGEGISPMGLLLGALGPTAVAILMFWIVP